jgi:hypothetical protein
VIYSGSALTGSQETQVSSPYSYEGKERVRVSGFIYLISEFPSVSNGDNSVGVLETGTSGSSESSRARGNMNALKILFTVREQEQVEEFVLRSDGLFAILLEVYDKIGDYFRSCLIDTVLEYDRDSEEDYEGLSVIIRTSTSPRISLDLLERFDFEWWLNVDSEIRSKVNIMVRPI